MSNGADLFPERYPYGIKKPWESRMEQQESQALAATQESEAQVRAIRPPLNWIIPFPARFGYPDVEQRTLTIERVLNGIGGTYPDRAGWRTGEGDIGGYTGADRNGMSTANPFG